MVHAHFHVRVHDVLGDAVDGFTQTQDVIGLLGGHGDLVLDTRIQGATHTASALASSAEFTATRCTHGISLVRPNGRWCHRSFGAGIRI